MKGEYASNPKDDRGDSSTNSLSEGGSTPARGIGVLILAGAPGIPGGTDLDVDLRDNCWLGAAGALFNVGIDFSSIDGSVHSSADFASTLAGVSGECEKSLSFGPVLAPIPFSRGVGDRVDFTGGWEAVFALEEPLSEDKGCAGATVASDFGSSADTCFGITGT